MTTGLATASGTELVCATAINIHLLTEILHKIPLFNVSHTHLTGSTLSRLSSSGFTLF